MLVVLFVCVCVCVVDDGRCVFCICYSPLQWSKRLRATVPLALMSFALERERCCKTSSVSVFMRLVLRDAVCSFVIFGGFCFLYA